MCTSGKMNKKKKSYLTEYSSAIRSLYHHMVCNIPVSCKANGDRNQLEVWLDSELIVEKYMFNPLLHNNDF